MTRSATLIRDTATPARRLHVPLPDPVITPTLTVPEAGELLNDLCRASAYAAARAGEIPTIRLRGRLLVPTAALLRMLGFEPQPPAR